MIQIDLGLLTAAGQLCQKQADHSATIRSYVSSVCDRQEAFSGVLNLFQGNYGDAVSAATNGLSSSMAIGAKMRTELDASREDFLDADISAHKTMTFLYDALGIVPVYVPPSTDGSVTPGGALPAPGAGTAQDPADGLGGDDLLDKGRSYLPDSDNEDKRPWWQKSARENFDDQRDKEQPFDEEGDKRRVEDDWKQRQRDQERQAGSDARDEAREDGATRREARDEGKEARRDQRDSNRQLNKDMDDAGDGVGTVDDLLDEGQDAVEGVHDLIDGVRETGENIDDHNEVEDFQNRHSDDELKEWAK